MFEIRRGIGIVIFFCIISLLLSSSFSLADELPLLPASYYGSITINEAPAPANTLLIAKIGDVTKRSLGTSLGEYGIENGIRLSVEGNTGETVYFCALNKRANEEIAWSTKDITELDLTFTTLTAGCVVSNGGDNNGDTGGGSSGGGGSLTPSADDEEESGQPDEAVVDLTVEEQATIPSTVEADNEVLFEFKESKISSVKIVFNENVENPSLTIEMTDSKPADAPEVKKKAVYKYLLISKNFESGQIKQATISFKVETTWMAQNNAGPGDIVLLHLNEDTGEWEELETTLTGLEGDFYKFEATIESFSLFAIAANPKKGFTFDIKIIAIIVLAIVIIFLILRMVKKTSKKVKK